MNQIARKTRYTYDDFCNLVKDGEKADLIDGVIYMASPDNRDAGKLFVWLIGLIDLFVEEKELGEVHGSRIACRLDNHNAPEPDILFVHKDRLGSVKWGGVEGPPDLAIEIVSPGSVDRDYKKKRAQYERFGIREYWIVDEAEKRVTLLRLGRAGKCRPVRPKKGELHSLALPGFWLRVAWLWQKPRPKKQVTLEEILARGTQ